MMTMAYVPGRVPLREPRLPVADFTGRGQQVLGYRYAKFDAASDEDLGALHPARGGTLSCDTGQAVTRSLRIALVDGEAQAWDPIAHRVRVWMVTGDGTEYALGGRYMSVDDTEAEGSGGASRPLALADETWQLTGEIGASFSAYSVAGDASTEGGLGANVARVAERFLNRYTLFNPAVGDGAPAGHAPDGGGAFRMSFRVDPTPFITAAAWTGTSAGTAVLADLALAGDYLAPWADNTGTLRMIRVFDPADPDRVPDFDFDTPGVVSRADDPAVTTDLIDATNRYRVVSNSGATPDAQTPVVGVYDVPSTAPWSIANRGYVVSKTESMPVATAAQAAAAARGLAARQQVYRRVTVATAANPLHDAHQVVVWRGERWLQTAWSLSLDAGGAMTHQLRRAYR